MFAVAAVVSVASFIIVAIGLIKRKVGQRSIENIQPKSGVNTLLVESIPLALWEKLGWRKKGNEYRGFYRTRFGSYPGRIVEGRARDFKFYIKDPPAALKVHPKWQCFKYCGKGNFWVHQSQPAKDVDGGIIEIQRIVEEAFSMTAAKK